VRKIFRRRSSWRLWNCVDVQSHRPGATRFSMASAVKLIVVWSAGIASASRLGPAIRTRANGSGRRSSGFRNCNVLLYWRALFKLLLVICGRSSRTSDRLRQEEGFLGEALRRRLDNEVLPVVQDPYGQAWYRCAESCRKEIADEQVFGTPVADSETQMEISVPGRPTSAHINEGLIRS
jgi:hypothetical protein